MENKKIALFHYDGVVTVLGNTFLHKGGDLGLFAGESIFRVARKADVPAVDGDDNECGGGGIGV